MTFPYVFTGDAILVYIGNKPHPVPGEHPQFGAIKTALTDPSTTPDDLLSLIDLRHQLTKKINWTSSEMGRVKVGLDGVIFDGEPVHGHLVDRMMQIFQAGLDIVPWCRFMENLYDNPSKTAVDELYLWLEKSNMPITERGTFLAYKKVRDDYLSYYDGKTANVIGTEVSMPRNKVDDNRHVTCSHGLHFCSWDYLPNYYGGTGRVVVVEINPADVVSIPSDYNNAKGRAWKYLVVGEVEEEKTQTLFEDTPIAPKADWSVYDKGFAAGGAAKKAGAEYPDLSIFSDEYADGFSDGWYDADGDNDDDDDDFYYGDEHDSYYD